MRTGEGNIPLMFILVTGFLVLKHIVKSSLKTKRVKGMSCPFNQDLSCISVNEVPCLEWIFRNLIRCFISTFYVYLSVVVDCSPDPSDPT